MTRKPQTRPLLEQVRLHTQALTSPTVLMVDRTLTVECFAAPNVIQLPDYDDDEKVPQRDTGRKGRTLRKRVPASKASHSASEPVAQQLDGLVWTSVSFADPLSTD